MATKNIYLYEVTIKDESTGNEVPLHLYKTLIQSIITAKSHNGAIKLSTPEEPETMLLDIIEDTEAYLYARLNRKRLNNSMQKRNYTTYETSDVLQPDEVELNGVEAFTYSILGYKHGILSIVNSKGAPTANTLSRIFSLYCRQYSLEIRPIPNQDLLRELVDGRSPEINKIQIDIPRPDADVLEKLFGFSETEIINSVRQNTASLVFEIKPDFRGALTNDKTRIAQIIDILKKNRTKYNSVVLSGKSSAGTRQQKFDLFEEYFKYPISIEEFHREGRIVREKNRTILQTEYRNSMQNVYTRYKDLILTVSGRDTPNPQ